jgi:outer membrane protein assembly factor BamB
VWKGNVFVSRRDPREKGPTPGEHLWRARGLGPQRMSDSKRARYLRSNRGSRSFRDEMAQDASVGFGTTPSSAKLDQAEMHVGTASISRAWSYQGSRPCVWNENIYSVVGDELSASRVESGEELWTWKAAFDDALDFEGRAITPPAVTNGRVYAGTRDGNVRCWDASSGEAFWSYPVSSCLVWQPVVANGWIYCGAPGGRLVALHTGDPLDDGWPMWGGGSGHCGVPAA